MQGYFPVCLLDVLGQISGVCGNPPHSSWKEIVHYVTDIVLSKTFWSPDPYRFARQSSFSRPRRNSHWDRATRRRSPLMIFPDGVRSIPNCKASHGLQIILPHTKGCVQYHNHDRNGKLWKSGRTSLNNTTLFDLKTNRVFV